MKEHPPEGLELVCEPDLKRTKLYDAHIKEFIELEHQIVK
jgi:xylulokinase